MLIKKHVIEDIRGIISTICCGAIDLYANVDNHEFCETSVPTFVQSN